MAYSDNVAGMWNLGTGRFTPFIGHQGEVNTISFNPSGNRAVTAGDDRTIRLWDTDTGLPIWKAPALLPAPARLFSHRGWEQMTPAGPKAKSKAPDAFEQAIAARAAVASVDPDLRSGCLVTFDGSIEHWALSPPKRLWQSNGKVPDRLLAVPGGCAVLADGEVTLVNSASARTTLAKDATGLARDGDGLLMAANGIILGWNPDGSRQTLASGIADVSALTRSDDLLILGFEHGAITTVRIQAEQKDLEYFTQTPPGRVTRLLIGPMDTLIAGYAEGQVGIWHMATGALLERFDLHGAIQHLLIEDRKLVMASELGDSQIVDLAVFHTPYCQLMERIWQAVPTVWEAGRARLRPPANQACLEPPEPPEPKRKRGSKPST